MSDSLSPEALQRLFTEARSFSSFSDRAVPAALLRQVFELARMGPTAQNSQPARFVFVTSVEARARLLTAVVPGNVPKVRAAPVTAIVAIDTRFHEEMPTLWHDAALPARLAANPALSDATARRNGTLVGAYLMLAARALGLDCGPMSGFDAQKVDTEFFPDGRWRSNFLCNIGYGDRGALKPRQRRLEFDEACRVI